MTKGEITLLSWVKEKMLQVNLVEDLHPKEGFYRLGFTDLETKAHAHFVQIAEELGLKVYEDEIGNKMARWETDCEDQRYVSSGSHLDTVSGGGAYDGAAGVVASLAAIKLLKDEGFKPERPLEVICFRLEEADRFGVSTIGSKAMAGLFDENSFAHLKDANGITLKEAVESQGYKWEHVKNAERDINDIYSFYELHIEQGKRLEGITDLGVVDAVTCPIRLEVTIVGENGHTGTTLMTERRDALVIASHIIQEVQEETLRINREEHKYPLMATVSQIKSFPNSISVIPGKVVLGIDIRSVDDHLKERLVNHLEKMSSTFDANISVVRKVNTSSVFLDEEIRETMRKEIAKTRDTVPVLESRAGHDVMNMQKKWPSGMLFIPCRDGISHSPREYAEIEHIVEGAKVIAAYYKLKSIV